MSQPLLVSLTLPVLAATLAAQNVPPEGIHIYPDTIGSGTTVFTRLTFGPAAGEALVQYPKSHFEGIADGSVAGATGNPICRLANAAFVIQDQNQQTAHNFNVVIRPAATAGGPDTNNANALFRVTGTSPTATGTGPAAWILWFVSPINTTIPCKGDFFFGLGFNANTNWPTSDGLATHAAYYDPKGNNLTTGDAVPPRTGVPNLTWEINASGAASQPTIAQVLDYRLISPYSMIQAGVRHKTGQSNHASTDGFGAASLYPSISGGTNGREDGLLVRITDNPPGNVFGGQFLLFMALSTGTQFSIPPIQLGGLFGSIYLGPVGQLPLGGGALSTTVAQTVVLLAPPGSIPPTAATQNVKIYFQAATTRQNSTVVAITNMAGVYY